MIDLEYSKYDALISDFSDYLQVLKCVTIFYEDRGGNMQHTEVVSYLIDALKESSLITYDKDFLRYIGIPVDKIHIKRLSGYINRSGEIRDRQFLKAIEKRFGFEKNLWSISKSRQIFYIEEIIRNELRAKQLPNESTLDISDIIHNNKPITQEQQSLLDFFSKLSNKYEEKMMISDFLNAGLLNKQENNQEFLSGLLKLAYKKGLYKIIIKSIIPNLHRKYRLFLETQEIEAHALGSLKKYDEAKHILCILINEGLIENINLRTAALSNYKRELLESTLSVNKEGIRMLIKGYKRLYLLRGSYSYYTGINLLYMMQLAKILFGDNVFEEITPKTIYEKSKPSLKTDKTHHEYFTFMSRFEFKLLLNVEGTHEKIESFLDNYNPHNALVERTLRQMKMFYRTIFHSNDPLLASFKKSIAILEGYCETLQ